MTSGRIVFVLALLAAVFTMTVSGDYSSVTVEEYKGKSAVEIQRTIGDLKKRAAKKRVKGTVRTIDPMAKELAKGKNGTSAGNSTAPKEPEAAPEPPKLSVKKNADFCLDYNRKKVPGTFKSPRPVGAVEFGHYATQLAKAKPTFVLTDAWEASINPNRLLGESHGFHCVGCEHPLSRSYLMGDVKRRSLLNYAAGKPFRRIIGCLREVNDECTMFCYEWGMREGISTKKATDYKSKSPVNHNTKAKSPFPPTHAKRVPNSVPEYTMPPVTVDNTPLTTHRVYEEPGQERNTAEGVMINDCICSCTTSNSTLATDRPFDCNCHCPPQHGNRGVEGPSGFQGERGDRGPGGRPGIRGPIGPAGNLDMGKHPFSPCDCHHERLPPTGETGGELLTCSKEGYLLAGMRKTECPSDGDVDCLGWIKCCRPCLKVEGAVPPKTKVFVETRFTEGASQVGFEPKDYRKLFRAGGKLNGYCRSEVDKFKGITNRGRCGKPGLKGVDHDIITRIWFKFRTHVRKTWQIRIGGDFGRGAIVTVDGKIWANRSGENIKWGGRWESEDVILGKPTVLAGNTDHSVEIFGIEGVGDEPADIQINFGDGWLYLSPGTLQLGCK